MARRALGFLLVFPFVAALLAAQPGTPPPGLLIRNGQLIDGTGGSARSADVRVAGDTIVEVGPGLTARPGERTIDARGEVIAPGFIDMHSHADRGLENMPGADTQVMQGITTALVGQDGGGDLPVSRFYTELERLRPGINFATSVGHGSVRSIILGDDYRRAATHDEIEMMKIIVDRAMRDGAIGLSSGLEYDPGFYAKTDELVALGSVVAKYGGIYSSHVRNENEGAFDSWREAIEIGRRNRIPVEISHIKLGVKSVWGRAAEGLKILEDARRQGVQVMADWYPYTYWQSSMYVLIDTRDYVDRKAWEKGLAEVGGARNVMITDYAADPSANGKTLDEIAAGHGTDAVSMAIDMMREGGPNTGVIVTSMSVDDLTAFFKSPLTLICSDGNMTGRHPRGYGTFPRVLAHYVRDLHAVSLPEAVAKMTGRSAAQLGFPDRGTIAVGKKADITIFDPATIQDRGVPGHAAQAPVGISYVIVNGQVVLDDGRLTGARPGRGLKRARPAQAS